MNGNWSQIPLLSKPRMEDINAQEIVELYATKQRDFSHVKLVQACLTEVELVGALSKVRRLPGDGKLWHWTFGLGFPLLTEWTLHTN